MSQTLNMQEPPSHRWSNSGYSKDNRLPYLPLGRITEQPYMHDEKTIVVPDVTSQVQDMLIVDDDEIYEDDNNEQEEDEEEDFVNLPPTKTENRRKSGSPSSSVSHTPSYDVSSIRKTRPLPKIPNRASSKDVQNMTQVLSENLKSQKKLTAQQLFQIMSKSSNEDSGQQEQEKVVEYNNDGDSQFDYDSKTQIPSPLLAHNNIINYSSYQYDHFNSNYHKMMTPVEEVDEEDQLFEAYEEDIAEEEPKVEQSSPTYLLEPIIVDNTAADNKARPLSEISLATPSLTSGRTSPSSDNSRQSMEQTIIPKEENQLDEKDSQIQEQEQDQIEYFSRQDIQPQYRQQPQDTDFSSLYAIRNDYGFQVPMQFQNQEQLNNNGQESLLSDVKRLSQLNQELMTPIRIKDEIYPQPSESTQSQPPIKRMSSSDDYSNFNASSPMTSFSLTHDKNSIKTYRRMATKTHDRNIQFTYAKYLLQLVSLYSTKNNNIRNSSQHTRDRLQEEAEYWIEKLAKANYAEALYIKGQWHLHCCDSDAVGLFMGSQYKKVNVPKAFKCFQQAAKFGSTEAHYELAEYWKEHKEYKKAMSSYRYAASKNHILSLYKLANILFRGLLNQEKDVRQGLVFLKKAADSNQPESARSAYDLACIYSNNLESIGLDRKTVITPSMSNHTFGLAVHYYKRADELGLIISTYRLGYIYEHGHLNTESNAWIAYKYYEKAAEKNHEGAMLEVSRLYKDGIPGYLNPHPQMAHKWCTRATEKGNEVAEYTLGLYYEHGIGVYADYAQALEWYSKSASKSYGPAERRLNIPSSKRMSMSSQTEEKINKPTKSSGNRKYYEESVRIAEKSRRTDAEQNCQIM